MWLLYLQSLMPQNRRNNAFRNKQAANKVPLMFLDVQSLTKGNNGLFGHSKQTSKVYGLYAAFKNL